MTKAVICVDLRHLRNLRSDKPDTTQKKRANRWFAPTRHTTRCLLMADRTAFPLGRGNIPLRFALPPLEGGRGDVPLRSDSVYPA